MGNPEIPTGKNQPENLSQDLVSTSFSETSESSATTFDRRSYIVPRAYVMPGCIEICIGLKHRLRETTLSAVSRPDLQKVVICPGMEQYRCSAVSYTSDVTHTDGVTGETTSLAYKPATQFLIEQALNDGAQVTTLEEFMQVRYPHYPND